MEWRIGSLDRRELCIRWYAPLNMCEYDGRDFRLRKSNLLNLTKWWVAIWKGGWRCEINRWGGYTHRCYCTEGSMIDGCLCAAGFGVQLFYSDYRGQIPCWCDRALESIRQQSEAETSGGR